jgi:HEAT repeat protein
MLVGSLVIAGGLTMPAPVVCLLPGVGLPVVAASDTASAASQPARPFEEVARDLDSRDPKTRVAAMRTLKEAGHPEAIGYIAKLLTDTHVEIQAEAIDTLIGFYMLDVPKKSKRIAGVIEVDGGSRAERAFERGPFILLPRPSPESLKTGLAGAMGVNNNPQIRLEAIYTLGALVPPPAGPEAEKALAANLRDPDGKIRLAATRVAGAVRATSIADALIATINDPDDKIKLAALRSVGDLKEPRAVKALEEQFGYYNKGTFARAAFDGLARIGDRGTLPLFQERLTDRDPAIRRLAIEGIVRTGDTAAIKALDIATAGENDNSAQLARAFALEKSTGRGLDTLVMRLSDSVLNEQASGYIVELGPGIVPALIPHLKDPDPRVRERIAQAMGLIGGTAARDALETTKRDPDVNVARAAERALARIRIIATTNQQ